MKKGAKRTIEMHRAIFIYVNLVTLEQDWDPSYSLWVLELSKYEMHPKFEWKARLLSWNYVHKWKTDTKSKSRNFNIYKAFILNRFYE